MKKFFILILFCLYGFPLVFGQNDKEKLGESLYNLSSGSYYNFSDKNKVNIEVNVWGYVRNPGKYLIPKGCTFQDLVSYSGGPMIEADLDQIRIFRPKNDSLGMTENKVINLNYKDLIWSDSINTKKLLNPVLEAGDILVFPGSPKYFFRDNVFLLASFVSVLLTLATLLVTLKK